LKKKVREKKYNLNWSALTNPNIEIIS